MTREQIEKAAMEYAVRNSWYPGETSYESDIKAMEESLMIGEFHMSLLVKMNICIVSNQRTLLMQHMNY